MEKDYSYGAAVFPVHVMLRSAGAACNLDCTYCSLLQEENKPSVFIPMAEKELSIFTKQYIDAQIHATVSFYWKGGEPMLRGIEFYRKAIEYQQLYGKGRKITNTLFTNATLLDSEWCAFLKKNDFLIRVYLDGPQHCHDHYRCKSDGNSSFEETMFGISLLKKFGIRFTIITSLNDYNVQFPLEIYRFFKHQGLRYIKFEPVLELENNHITEWSLAPLSYGSFLCDIFDEWVRHDVGRQFISIFDDTLNVFCRNEPENCFFSTTCGHTAVADYEGSLYSCEKFLNEDYKLGNIHDQTITGLMYSRKQLRFGQLKKNTLTHQCKKCDYLRFCHGGCPKHRIANSISGEKGHNFFCIGYRHYFEHVTPAMTFMAEEIASGGSPARVMSFFEIS